MSISISITKSVTTTDTGKVKLTVTTVGANVTSKVFAIEVYPASADSSNAEYRFSHICSPMELEEFPEDEPGESSYFRTDAVTLIFDTAAMAKTTYETIEKNVTHLVYELNQLEDLAGKISSTVYDTAAMLAAPMELQFSVDGSTDWHDTQVDADRYYRMRNSVLKGDWSTKIKMVTA